MVKEKKYYRPILLGLLLLVGLWATSLYSYLLFHSIAEIFSIVIAFCIFMLAWNSRDLAKNSYLLFIGIAYLFVGGLDLIHTLAYKGMGIFQGYHTNLSTQLWITARYVESISLLIAPFLIGRKLKADLVVLCYIIVTALLLGSLFYWHVFPVCFIEGLGLTAFKKVSEYIISFILLISTVALFNKRKEFERDILRLLIASIVITIASESAFTLYADPYGLFNLIGHYLKIISFYLIYIAIIKTGLTKPFALLFRELKQSEDALRGAKENLELQVDMRTAELTKASEALRVDITKRKRAEKLLKDSEARFRMIYEHAPVMIDAFDVNGRCVMWNKECEKVFGWTAEEIFSHENPLMLFYPDPEVRRQVVETVTSKPEMVFREWKPKRKDGSEAMCLWANFKLPDGLVINIGYDITEHKQAEEEIRLLREEYTHIARVSAMGELVASLAHELKQPLTAIRSNAQAAQRFLTGDKPDIDELHEVLKDIIKDNRRADDVIGKLRALMRKSELQITELNINEVVHDILPLVNSYEIMRNISLKLELDENIQLVAGDRIQLQQVFLNLILNSTEALMNEEMKLGTIVVRTSQKHTENVVVSVKDNGLGIEEKAMSHLFEPFYTTKKEGLGMGLAISRSIIEEHGGRSWAENNPDSGATFYFTIPVSKGASA